MDLVAGKFNDEGTPIIAVSLKGVSDPIFVILDTGFDGHLMLPYPIVKTLNLKAQGYRVVIDAMGKEHLFENFKVWIRWFGAQRNIPVLSRKGCPALLGTGLLQFCVLLMERKLNRVIIFKA